MVKAELCRNVCTFELLFVYLLTFYVQWLNFSFCFLGISQQPDPGFTGATTPQSPLMSPRLAHTQSPMIQQSQANPAYQSSTEMNGWAQGNMGGNR